MQFIEGFHSNFLRFRLSSTTCLFNGLALLAIAVKNNDITGGKNCRNLLKAKKTF